MGGFGDFFNKFGGAIIGGLGSIGGAVGGNLGNKRSMHRKTRDDRTNWAMENEYNHPSAQMARLREAGLNPNLIYGSGSSQASGNASSIAPSGAAAFESPNIGESFSHVAQLKNTRAQTNNVMAKTTNTFQDTALKGAQTATEVTKNSQSKFNLGLSEELRNNSLNVAQWGLKQQEANLIEQQLGNTLKFRTLKPQIMDIFYRMQNTKETLRGTRLQNEMKQYEVQLNKMNMTKNDPLWARMFKMGIDKMPKSPPQFDYFNPFKN